MKYALFVVLLFTSISSFAQDCDKELLSQKPGKWKAGPQGSVQNVSATDLVKEKSVMTGIHKMISSSYKPKGCEISYSTAFGKNLPAGRNWIADPYTYSMFILRYLCDAGSADKSKYYVDYSTPTTVNISANVIWAFNMYGAELPEDDMRGYLRLDKRPEKKDGFYFMGEEVVGDSHSENKIKEYRWLITYTDTLPFTYVSRRDYLLIQKERLEKYIKEVPSEKKYSDAYLKNISEFLKKPASELDQVAICMRNEEERFEKFVPEGTRGSFIAVQPNPAYYHRKLPKSSPQFFTVVYKISHGDAVFEENISNIKKTVDFEALKKMLGK